MKTGEVIDLKHRKPTEKEQADIFRALTCVENGANLARHTKLPMNLYMNALALWLAREANSQDDPNVSVDDFFRMVRAYLAEFRKAANK